MPNLDQATKLSSGDMQNSDMASDAAYTLQWKGCTLQSLSIMETGGGELVRARSLGKKIKDSGYAHRSQDKRHETTVLSVFLAPTAYLQCSLSL